MLKLKIAKDTILLLSRNSDLVMGGNTAFPLNLKLADDLRSGIYCGRPPFIAMEEEVRSGIYCGRP